MAIRSGPTVLTPGGPERPGWAPRNGLARGGIMVLGPVVVPSAACPRADRHRGHKDRPRADRRLGADRGPRLVPAVEVRRDCAGTDIDPAPEVGVAEVGQV